MEIEQRYRDVANRYQQAATGADFEQVLSELEPLLDEPSLSGPSYWSARLLQASCLGMLGRERETVLRSLLSASDQDDWARERGMPIQVALELAGDLTEADRGEEALPYYEMAMAWFSAAGDVTSQAAVHRSIAAILVEGGDQTTGIEHLEAAWALLEDADPGPLQVDVLHTLGHALYVDGRLPEAVTRLEQGYGLATEYQDLERAAPLLENLVVVTVESQDFRRALRYLSRAKLAAEQRADFRRVQELLITLGGCQVESGRPGEALRSFAEAESLAETVGPFGAAQLQALAMARSRAHLDLKQYEQADLELQRAVAGPVREPLIEEISQQLERETGGPLLLDCAHRSLKMALTGTSNDLSHSNVAPDVQDRDLSFLMNRDLTTVQRSELGELAEAMESDFLGTKYGDSSGPAPAGMQMGIKLHYVDDVDEFEHRWALLALEQRRLRNAERLFERWQELRQTPAPAPGDPVRPPEEMVAHAHALTELAELFVLLGDSATMFEIAIHAADALEVSTNDPLLAAMLWSLRARVFAAASQVCPSWAGELVEAELNRSLSRGIEAHQLLSPERRRDHIAVGLDSWIELANSQPSDATYRSLLSIVGDLQDEVGMEQLDAVAIAMSATGDHAGAVALIDRLVSTLEARHPDTRLVIGSGLGWARATSRFANLSADEASCRQRFGPFTFFIYREVKTQRPDLSPLDPPPAAPSTHLAQLPPLAGSHQDLIVIDSRYAPSLQPLFIEHELAHAGRRAGQSFGVADGRWLPVRRDVPIASAITYVRLLETDGLESIEAARRGLDELVAVGRGAVEEDPLAAPAHIDSMLRYFDDLGPQETPASYPCAAILVGMAFGLLGDDARDEVLSYLRHLAVMDHTEALEFGRRKCALQL